MMDVTPKAYKIWKRLFKEPNIWLDLGDIAYDVNMTCRQVSSVVQTMNSAYIRKSDNGKQRPAIKLCCDGEELELLKREVIISYNQLNDEIFDTIRASLSPVGWTSAQDVALITGYHGATINIATQLMDDVVSKDAGKSKYYMLG